jgi:hypothetical protein
LLTAKDAEDAKEKIGSLQRRAKAREGSFRGNDR